MSYIFRKYPPKILGFENSRTFYMRVYKYNGSYNLPVAPTSELESREFNKPTIEYNEHSYVAILRVKLSDDFTIASVEEMDWGNLKGKRYSLHGNPGTGRAEKYKYDCSDVFCFNIFKEKLGFMVLHRVGSILTPDPPILTKYWTYEAKPNTEYNTLEDYRPFTSFQAFGQVQAMSVEKEYNDEDKTFKYVTREYYKYPSGSIVFFTYPIIKIDKEYGDAGKVIKIIKSHWQLTLYANVKNFILSFSKDDGVTKVDVTLNIPVKPREPPYSYSDGIIPGTYWNRMQPYPDYRVAFTGDEIVVLYKHTYGYLVRPYLSTYYRIIVKYVNEVESFEKDILYTIEELDKRYDDYEFQLTKKEIRG